MKATLSFEGDGLVASLETGDHIRARSALALAHELHLADLAHAPMSGQIVALKAELRQLALREDAP